MKTNIIPVFIPHLGCPHLCTFCNQKKISGSLKAPDKEEIVKLVEEYLCADFSKVYEIAFFGGSFTALEIQLQEYYLETAAQLKRENKINKIRFSTRPDCITKQVLNLAKKYKVDMIELGLQSMDDRVLEVSERGHTSLDTINAVNLIKEHGFSLGLQIMPGLMEDTEKSIDSTIEKTVNLRPDFVRIYPTIIIKGTKLEEYYDNDQFIPLSLDKIVPIVARAYERFTEAGIKVIRMGLQHSENLTSEKDLIAGPYHPAFGELVFSEIYKNKMISLLDGKELTNNSKGIVKIAPGEVSKARGHKNSNVNLIKERYHLSLNFKEDILLEKGKIEIEV